MELIERLFDAVDTAQLVLLLLVLCSAAIWVVVGWRRDRREGLALLRWFVDGELAEHVVPWAILALQTLYVIHTGKKLLGFLFPWPVATAIAGIALWGAIRRRRRGKISKALAARYVLYCLAFWAFYAVPGRDPWTGVLLAFFLLLGSNMIIFWWG